MALHGELKVNSRVIAEWSARRIREITTVESAGPRYIYECTYIQPGWHERFEVGHFHNDGAAVLTSLLFAEVARIRKAMEHG